MEDATTATEVAATPPKAVRRVKAAKAVADRVAKRAAWKAVPKVVQSAAQKAVRVAPKASLPVWMAEVKTGRVVKFAKPESLVNHAARAASVAAPTSAATPTHPPTGCRPPQHRKRPPIHRKRLKHSAASAAPATTTAAASPELKTPTWVRPSPARRPSCR